MAPPRPWRLPGDLPLTLSLTLTLALTLTLTLTLWEEKAGQHPELDSLRRYIERHVAEVNTL